jgi:hypothetical protein
MKMEGRGVCWHGSQYIEGVHESAIPYKSKGNLSYTVPIILFGGQLLLLLLPTGMFCVIGHFSYCIIYIVIFLDSTSMRIS